MATNVLIYWLLFLFVLFVIVFAIMFVGYRRVRSARPVSDRNVLKPTMDARKGPIAERLGDYERERSSQGYDPRGDDVGGNFPGVPRGKNTVDDRTS